MGMASCGGVSLPRLSLDCSCPPAHEMLAPLARWHGPGGPPGRGAATGPRAPRPDGETAGGRAPRRGRPTAPPTPPAALPGALSLGGAAGPVTCGRPEHLITCEDKHTWMYAEMAPMHRRATERVW